MYLLFDIGGTNMRLAVSEDGKKIKKKRIVPTPKNFARGVARFKEIAKSISGGKIKAAAGGLPGPLNKDRSRLLTAPQLPDWAGKPLRESLKKSLDVPVYLENDVALVALGEANYGAGKGYPIVAYCIIGTGVNGARIVDGKIDKTAFGFEIGHQIINTEAKFSDALGIRGSLEAYVGGANVERRFGKKPYEIKDNKVWNELAGWLSVGLNNTIVHWSPDILVLGGSMMKGVGIKIEDVENHLKKTLKVFPNLPKIKKARLGKLGGLWGALAYLKQMQKSNQNPH